jgi:2-phosphoglycerate kinase
MVYPNGYRPGGSTKTNDPKSTPASDGCTPNVTSFSAAGVEHPTPHEDSERRRTAEAFFVGRLRVKRRLLLIGGAAGTGKSTVARTLATRLNAAWLQLDTLWIAMRDAAPPNSKDRALLDIDQRIRAQDEPAEALLDHHIAASEAVCAALPHALAFELQTHPTLVADGAWLLPEFAAQLHLDDVSIRSVFLHESDPEQVARAMSARRGVPMVAAWHAEGARLAWMYGNWLADEAGRLALPVVSSRPYATAADRLLALT